MNSIEQKIEDNLKHIKQLVIDNSDQFTWEIYRGEMANIVQTLANELVEEYKQQNPK